jgi:mono/diheme cytochrome c family protein
MGCRELGTMEKFLTAYVIILVCLLLVGCGLSQSPRKGATSQSSLSSQAANVGITAEGNYIESCRAKGVPVPPDWKPSSEWESHGNLKTILLTPNNLDQVPVDDTSFASVWSYAPPQGRGACIALGRSGGSFQVICQSATTGHACFWGNDSSSPGTSWTPETVEVPIASLRDPVQGFAPGTVSCTECHRGNNAFLYAPDDSTWATLLRPEHPRPTFTTRVEQSSQQGKLTFGTAMTTYPRFIPIGGKAMALNNPLPSSPGCSGSCHELHSDILQKNHTVEGYVRIPRPMGPSCAADSPPDDPTRNCYQR